MFSVNYGIVLKDSSEHAKSFHRLFEEVRRTLHQLCLRKRTVGHDDPAAEEELPLLFINDLVDDRADRERLCRCLYVQTGIALFPPPCSILFLLK